MPTGKLGNLVLLLATLLSVGCAGDRSGGNLPQAEREAVVLLHGLGRSTSAMRYLQHRLEKAGYEVFNIGYPSTSLPPDDLLELLRDEVRSCCAKKKKVHFVGHSLGGILIRALLEEQQDVKLGRVVLLGVPNQGAELADWLSDNYLFKKLAGPTGQQLGTGETAWPGGLPAPDYELGVIAGTRSINPVGSWILAGPDDGFVSVESTKVKGMKDFMLTASGHVLMRYSDEVADAVIRFLKTGNFSGAVVGSD